MGSRFGEPVALRLEAWKFTGACDWLCLTNGEVYGKVVGGIQVFGLATVIETSA